MSGSKYANLPDIDTAPDIYETDDVFVASQNNKTEVSDDEGATHQRPSGVKKAAVGVDEGIDQRAILDTDEATRRFKKAERRRDKPRLQYVYPSSPTSSSSEDEGYKPSTLSLSHRLRAVKAELASLETELADPSNPLLLQEKDIDAGELIRGVVDVRSRLDKIRKDKEGRGKLVGMIVKADKTRENDDPKDGEERKSAVEEKSAIRTVVDMDHRVGELEKIIGASTTTLDELNPLPQPLLPLISRLNMQLTLLTQPRHLDSISRRLKLLLSDLERTSASQHSHRRHPSQNGSPNVPSQIQEHLLPLLNRLGPSLPQIPHILTRLRTLSALHSAAGEFQEALHSLEEEQGKIGDALSELENAVDKLEHNMEENRGIVKGNVEGLENRVDNLFRRLDTLEKAS